MRRRPRGRRQKSAQSLLRPQVAHAPDSLRATMAAWLESLAIRNFSEATVRTRADAALRFACWCEERALTRPAEVSRALLERYQRQLFLHRKPSGRPLSAASQANHLTALRQYFKYLVRQSLLPANPASELQLPKLPVRLPYDTLTEAEVERVLAQPDVSTLEGLRDRAILEVLWACAVRRAEVCGLGLYDVQGERGVVQVREGKGKKGRIVPISERALSWVARYLAEVRPRHAVAPDEGVLFLSSTGAALHPVMLSGLVHRYVRASGVRAHGACHLFRHAAATAMLERGADIRFVQELLGHARLDTTVVYTRVTITKLKAVYAATHPAAQAQLLAELAVESDDETVREP